MMDDDLEIEARLRAFRPAGPPETLRERVLTGAGRRHAGVWWEVAAAVALILAGTALNQLSARANRRIGMVLAPVVAAHEHRVEALALVLGGDAPARAAAESWAADDDFPAVAP